MSTVGSIGAERLTKFHAVQSRTVFYQYMFIAVAITVCGVLVILVALYMLLNTDPKIYHVFMMAVSFAVIVVGVDIGRHNWPKGNRQSVVVDLRSVRLLEEGHVRKQFVFDQRVRIGGSFNAAFHVPEFKPLQGVEFEREGEVIEVSPRESFLLDDVRRLWPMVLLITKKHGLRPTGQFAALLDREAKRDDYWRQVRDELAGKKRKPEVPAKRRNLKLKKPKG